MKKNRRIITVYILCLLLSTLLGCSLTKHRTWDDFAQRTPGVVSTERVILTTGPLSTTVSLETTKTTPTLVSTMDYAKGVGIISARLKNKDGFDEAKSFIVNPYGDVIHTFIHDEPYLSAYEDPCSLKGISSNENGIRIDVINLDGEVKQSTLVSIDPVYQQRVKFYNYYNLSSSPDGNWIGFVWPSGIQGMDPLDSEHLNLGIINTSANESRPISVTLRGGSTRHPGTWSPNGKTLLYTDLDEKNIQQIFSYDLHSGKRSQISKFTSITPVEIVDLQFSPNGRSVAIIGIHHVVLDRTKDEGRVGVLYWESKDIYFYPLPDPSMTPYLISPIFWDRNNERFVTLLRGDYIGWFEINHINIQIFPKQNQERIDITQLFPLNGLDSFLIFGKEILFLNSPSEISRKIGFPEILTTDLTYFTLPMPVDLSKCD